MLSKTHAQRVAAALGAEIAHATPLTGGCVATVVRADLANGRAAVVKTLPPADPVGLIPEAHALRALAPHAPAPEVLHAEHDLLVMTFLDTAEAPTDGPGAEPHAAEILAALHSVTAPRFGLDAPTAIGGLLQPNDRRDSWIDFYRDLRIRHMAAEAQRIGNLPADVARSVEHLAERLDEFIAEPHDGHARLIHGDVWSGNVIATRSRIVGLIDPSTHYAHPEVELAFITMFNTFGRAFFDRYAELRAPDGFWNEPQERDAFFATRRLVYLVYPLLVHTRLFGGSYVSQLAATLRSLGLP